jgi:hypothetical protein
MSCDDEDDERDAIVTAGDYVDKLEALEAEASEVRVTANQLMAP